jgi:pimeloyl-ACP methyl ester carboxylesterase
MRQATIRRTSHPPSPARGRPARRPSAWTRGLVAVTGLLVITAGINAGLLIRDVNRFPPPGELVQLTDGRNLHLDVSGTGNAGPTVILDSGHGAFSPAMRHLHQALSDEVRVVSYDRSGYGWSDPASSDRDPLAVNDDLREALDTASIDGPFIVVGHSLGALYARGFAASYPSEVVGLVLIDPAHENQLERLPAEVVAQIGPPSWLEAPLLAAAHLGVLRVLGPGASTTVGLPPGAEAELHAFTVTPRYLRTHLAEGRNFDRPAASVRPVESQLPTVVLSAPVALPGFEQARPAMDAMNRELAQRFPDSPLIEISGADHLSIITDHQHAAKVATVVLELHGSTTPPPVRTDEQDRP